MSDLVISYYHISLWRNRFSEIVSKVFQISQLPPSRTLMDLTAKMQYSLKQKCMVGVMISIWIVAHRSQKDQIEISQDEWPDALWWSVLFHGSHLNLHTALPGVYHTSLNPFKGFIAWLKTQPYLDAKKNKRPGTHMACVEDFAAIFLVVAMLERDILLSMSTEPDNEGDDLFRRSCLTHAQLDQLHNAIKGLKEGMGYRVD